jgi:hypothetical protein
MPEDLNFKDWRREKQSLQAGDFGGLVVMIGIIDFNAKLRDRKGAHRDAPLLEWDGRPLTEFEDDMDDNIRLMLMQIGCPSRIDPPRLKLVTWSCAEIRCGK